MELILLAVILTIFLALAPVRAKSHSVLSAPAAVWRHVDIDELRNASPRVRHNGMGADDPDAAKSHRMSPGSTVPTIEEDNVETLTCENKRIIALSRGDILLLRIEND